jgi:hypothetical protein
MIEKIKCKGDIEITKEWDDGKIEHLILQNSVLAEGRKSLAASLANSYGDNYDYFISRMVFGEGGTAGGVPKYVTEERTGLFTSVIEKGVIANIDPNDLTQVVFTSVLSRSDANGYTINELGLKMNSGNLYSMSTFGGFSKTSQMQVTFTWRVAFI